MTKNLILILASKKRTILTPLGIFVKKGVSTKNAIIKIKGCVVPKSINIKLYYQYYINKESVKHLKYFK